MRKHWKIYGKMPPYFLSIHTYIHTMIDDDTIEGKKQAGKHPPPPPPQPAAAHPNGTYFITL